MASKAISVEPNMKKTATEENAISQTQGNRDVRWTLLVKRKLLAYQMDREVTHEMIRKFFTRFEK